MSDTPVGAQGMVVHRDPATGKVDVAPPDTAPSAARQSAPSPVVALPETPGRTPAGGVKLDLQGRLVFPVRAIIGADGTPQVECAAPARDGTE